MLITNMGRSLGGGVSKKRPPVLTLYPEPVVNHRRSRRGVLGEPRGVGKCPTNATESSVGRWAWILSHTRALTLSDRKGLFQHAIKVARDELKVSEDLAGFLQGLLSHRVLVQVPKRLKCPLVKVRLHPPRPTLG